VTTPGPDTRPQRRSDAATFATLLALGVLTLSLYPALALSHASAFHPARVTLASPLSVEADAKPFISEGDLEPARAPVAVSVIPGARPHVPMPLQGRPDLHDTPPPHAA